MTQQAYRKPYLPVLTCFIVVVIIGCMTGPHPGSKPAPTYWPSKGWLTSTPEQQGMDSNVLADALGYIREQEMDVHSLLIIRHGYVILDVYFYPYTGKTVHDVASVTKSITTTRIGIAFKKGYIEDLNQPDSDFFPELKNMTLGVEKKNFTIKDLMTMSSGLNCGYRPGEPELFAMLKSEDWVKFTFDLPMATRPGTDFAYCSCGMHLLSTIITRTTGMSELDFARENLFAPLGIKEVVVMWQLSLFRMPGLMLYYANRVCNISLINPVRLKK